MLLRPRRNRARLAFTSRRTRLRVRERPQLPRTLFRGSIAWLIGSLSTLRRNGLPRSHARLARGCWLNSAARDSHPLGFTERFQLCFSFYIASSSRELTWRNPVLCVCLGGRGRLPARGSRSPVRAYINAYGSSSHGLACGRQAEWIASAGGKGYLSSSRLKRSHVIPRSRLRRDNQRRQIRTTHRRNADKHWLLPVIP